MKTKDCPRQKIALIDFIQKSKPTMLEGNYHDQLKNVPVRVLENMKNAIEKEQKKQKANGLKR